ncbi:HDOD domain-containing protein [Shewanella sp. MF05960]|uniref:HDOD domain-containing protein n=1 Tax=Shewanella sp. MF05960 TaxID=3434874 RepID=UPI003D7BBED5
MKKLTALFIDDDVFMLKALQRTARRAKPDWDFYLCEHCNDWQSALPEGVIPDVVFCDYLMPKKNGDEVLLEIANIIPSAVRVLLTGDTGEDVVTKVSAITHFVLKKPFSADDLNHVFSCIERLDALNFNLETRNKFGRIGYYFALPTIVTELHQLFTSDDVDIEQAAALIIQESFIAAKIIQIANSAFLGYSRQTVSLEEAIKRLGLKMTETIVISMAVGDCLVAKVPSNLHRLINEWAFNFSNQSRQLSKSLGFNSAMLDIVSMAALLTGIGQLALIAESDEYINSSDNDKQFFVLRDASILTVYILTLWGFSVDLCKVILMQDNPDFHAQEDNEDKLGLILYLVKLKLLCKLEHTEKESLKNLVVDTKIVDWIGENL